MTYYSRALDLGARIIGLILEANARVRFRISIGGLENFTRSPGTLALFNHLRDSDVPMIGNALFGGWQLLRPNRTLGTFMARDDMFRRGFLAAFLPQWPAVVRRPLALLDVNFVFRALRAYPVRRIPEQTLWEVLSDVLKLQGNLPLDRVLREECLARFKELDPGSSQPLHVRDALSDRFYAILRETNALLKLRKESFAALKPYEQDVVQGQFARFVELLEDGAILQMAPEGTVSADGRFARLRSGLYDLVNRVERPLRVLPVGISYDFLQSGRVPVFISMGREIAGLKGLSSDEMSARVAEGILAEGTVTASHLAGGLILSTADAGGRELTGGQIGRHVARETRRWVELGARIDARLLRRRSRARRVRGVVAYAVRHKLLVPLGQGRFAIPPDAGSVTLGNSRPPVTLRFVANHLESIATVYRPTELSRAEAGSVAQEARSRMGPLHTT